MWASSTCLESGFISPGACYGKGREMLTVSHRFFKTMAGFAYNIPIIGPYLARGLQVAGDKAGANERAHKDLPV